MILILGEIVGEERRDSGHRMTALTLQRKKLHEGKNKKSQVGLDNDHL